MAGLKCLEVSGCLGLLENANEMRRQRVWGNPICCDLGHPVMFIVLLMCAVCVLGMHLDGQPAA